MSGIAIMIPVRGRHNGKSRLMPVLASDERSRLVAVMANHVIRVALDAIPDGMIHVITQDPDGAWLPAASHPRVSVVREPEGTSGLNAAIETGRTVALEAGATRLLVLSADLPLLTVADLHHLLATNAEVVLATDKAGNGTNALLLGGNRALHRFPFRFGEGSRHLHGSEARSLGCSLVVVDTPGLNADLDTPGDWHALPEALRHRLLDGLLDVSGPRPGTLILETA